jgi:hypothetical protein
VSRRGEPNASHFSARYAERKMADKLVGAALANGDEKTIKNIESLLGAGLADLRCQVIEADTLVELGKFVAAEIKEAEDEL